MKYTHVKAVRQDNTFVTERYESDEPSFTIAGVEITVSLDDLLEALEGFGEDTPDESSIAAFGRVSELAHGLRDKLLIEWRERSEPQG